MAEGKEDYPYECAKCGTKYKKMADAIACGCRRRDKDE
jgi:hypothetical protein